MKKFFFLLMAFAFSMVVTVAQDVGKQKPPTETVQVTGMHQFSFSDYAFVQVQAPALMAVQIVRIKTETPKLISLLTPDAILWRDPGRNGYGRILSNIRNQNLQLELFILNNNRDCKTKKYYYSEICANGHV